jgi:hypothetical protein
MVADLRAEESRQEDIYKYSYLVVCDWQLNENIHLGFDTPKGMFYINN